MFRRRIEFGRGWGGDDSPGLLQEELPLWNDMACNLEVQVLEEWGKPAVGHAVGAAWSLLKTARVGGFVEMFAESKLPEPSLKNFAEELSLVDLDLNRYSMNFYGYHIQYQMFELVLLHLQKLFGANKFKLVFIHHLRTSSPSAFSSKEVCKQICKRFFYIAYVCITHN